MNHIETAVRLMSEKLAGKKHHWLEDDFGVGDVGFLKATVAPGMEYLWAVRDTGTYLWPLGVHKRINQEAAVIKDDYRDVQERYFHLVIWPNNVTLRQVDRSRAISLIDRLDYKIAGESVWAHRSKLGDMWFSHKGYAGTRPKVGVDLYPCSGLSPKEQIVLELISRHEAVSFVGTLFMEADVTWHRPAVAA